MDVVLNQRLAPGRRKRFEFVEQELRQSFALEPGFEQFLNDKSLSADATEEEIEFLKTLRCSRCGGLRLCIITGSCKICEIRCIFRTKLRIGIAMKKINPDEFRVRPGKNIDLASGPPGKPVYSSKDEYEVCC